MHMASAEVFVEDTDVEECLRPGKADEQPQSQSA
jgi:hypothetical protein